MKLIRKYTALLVMVLLLAPSVIQLAHSLHEEHAEVEVCISKDEQHFHEHELDCDTCTFHFNNFNTASIISIPVVDFIAITATESCYNSFKNTSVHSFHLRGPPALA